MIDSIFFKVIGDPESNFSWNGYYISPFAGNRVRINEEDFDKTPDIQTASTDTK